MGALARRREAAIASGEEWQKVQWARRVMRYVEREHGTAAKVSDPTLLRWIDDAMATINRRAGASPPDVEALYLRGDLKASGNFPTYHVKDPRDAFTDFEKSGRAGFPASWYRIGRDYELHHSYALSKDAYERGCQLKDTNSTFRMGRAYLFGQLKVKQDFEKALSLLKLAADMANEDLPEPSFFFGQLHAGEYAHLKIPSDLLRPMYDPASAHVPPSAEQLALRYIERAAYLNHASAQLKLGWAYEYAKIECPFDPLLSVQYYSLASKGGKAEADVALSRWFLCGAEGCFEKNEALAFTFAEKATRRSLPAAEFALAYYYEVGVGCEKNLSLAMKWYRRSAAQGNADAQDRLTALAGSKDAAVSRSQYEAELDSQMTRGHTAARNLSIREGRGRRGAGRRPVDATAASISIEGGLQSVNLADDGAAAAYPGAAAPQELSRKRTLRMVNELATTQQPHHASPASGRSTPSYNQPRSRVGSSSDQPALASPGQIHQQRAGINRTPSPSGRRANGTSGPYVTPPPPQQRMQSNPGTLLTPGTPEQRDLGNRQGRRGSAATAASERRVSESAGVETPGGGRKYSTFAEMGLQSSAMDKDKDCMIM
jgi:TPR repeat protein